MKSFVIILAFSIAIMTFAVLPAQSASSPEESFNKANKAYQDKEYLKAVDLYESLLKSGYNSPDLYFNLGNAYYKLKKVPESILNYERAKRLAPDDEDISFNLRVANLRTVDKINPIPKFFLTEMYENLLSANSSHKWSVTAVLLSWLTFGLLAIFLVLWHPLYKKLLFALAVLSFLGLLFSAYCAWQMNTRENDRNYAIIFAPSIYIKSSPEDSGTNLVTLHEGAKVKILDAVGDWKKIRIADGNVGWLPANAIEII